MSLDTANTKVLHAIASVHDDIILGFLPIPEVDVNSILSAVRDAVRIRGSREIFSLLDDAPAATAYALAVAPSRTLTEGGQFWPALLEDLGLDVAVQRRQELADHFTMVCDFLGLVPGTLENTRYTIAAPFIFQAGILHYWRNPLADALRKTLRSVPAPDLEDERLVRTFVHQLADRIHGQNLLYQLLQTRVGTLLCRRLITAYVTRDWEVLPAHLQQTLRESFSEIGRGAVLRSPYIAFDDAQREVVLVLPAQSSKWASESTVWTVNGRRFSARKETMVPTRELESSPVSVGMRSLLRDAADPTFTLSINLDEQTPFRIFRKDTGREKRIDFSYSLALPIGAYVVVLAKSISTNDEAYVRDCGEYRLLEFDLRPGDNPVILNRDAEEWVVTPLLQAGFYLDRDHAKTVQVENDNLLHYGQNLGLVAYFPAEAIKADESWNFRLTCVKAGLDDAEQLPMPEPKGGAYVFNDSLKALTDNILTRLSPGIHKLEVTLSHSRAAVCRSLWYWHGLMRISDTSGFICGTPPLNIDYMACRGVHRADNGLAFETQYHAPFVLIALSDSQGTLKLAHAGVQLTLFERGWDWEDEANPRQTLVVTEDDKRLVRFRSGGFQRWVIRGNDHELAILDANHQVRVLTLSGIAQAIGGAGRISAFTERGRMIPLASLARPLLASVPVHTENNGPWEDIWRFEIPKADLSALSVVVTGLSDDPDASPSDPIPILVRDGDVLQLHTASVGNGNIVVRARETRGGNEWHHDVSAALEAAEADVETAPRDTLWIEVLFRLTELKDELWTLEFVRRDHANGDWISLQCKEVHGVSSVRLLGWGVATPSPESNWWRRLRGSEETPPLTIEQLQLGLNASRRFLSCKYASSVWRAHSTKLENLPIVLAKSRISPPAGEGSIWWAEASTELAEYASTEAVPVIRQFLFGCKLLALCLPRALAGPLAATRSASPVLRALDIPARIHAAGGLKNFVLSGMQESPIDENIVYAYANFQNVDSGRDADFRNFSLSSYLNGVAGGPPGLGTRVEELHEQCSRYQVTQLLGPEHLLSSIKALNRRCRPFEAMTDHAIEAPLVRYLRSLEALSQGLESVAPSLADALGLDLPGEFYWLPPLLENESSRKAASLIWALAAAVRLCAHGRLSDADFRNQMRSLFSSGTATNNATLRNHVCMLLSLGPELFAFYFGLFDMQFAD